MVKPGLHVRVLHGVWCVTRDACSSNCLKMERMNPYAPIFDIHRSAWERSTHITQAQLRRHLMAFPRISPGSMCNHVRTHSRISFYFPICLHSQLRKWVNIYTNLSLTADQNWVIPGTQENFDASRRTFRCACGFLAFTASGITDLNIVLNRSVGYDRKDRREHAFLAINRKNMDQ